MSVHAEARAMRSSEPQIRFRGPSRWNHPGPRVCAVRRGVSTGGLKMPPGGPPSVRTGAFALRAVSRPGPARRASTTSGGDGSSTVPTRSSGARAAGRATTGSKGPCCVRSWPTRGRTSTYGAGGPLPLPAGRHRPGRAPHRTVLGRDRPPTSVLCPRCRPPRSTGCRWIRRAAGSSCRPTGAGRAASARSRAYG